MEIFQKSVVEFSDLMWEEANSEGYLGLTALLKNIKKDGAGTYQLDDFLCLEYFSPSSSCIEIPQTESKEVFSAILNLVSLLQHQLENEEMATSLINKLAPFLPTQFGDNTKLQTICARLWTACSRNRLSITFQDRLAEVNPQYLHNVVSKTIRECTMGARVDLTCLKINDTYQKEILPLSLRSNETFRVFINWIASQMMEYPGKQASYQIFLTEFLDTLRSEMLHREFRAMYPNDLINEITILEELENCSDQTFSMEILEAARNDCYQNFVILASSIAKYNHLLLK